MLSELNCQFRGIEIAIYSVIMYIVEVKGNIIIRGGSQHSHDKIVLEGRPLSQAKVQMIEDSYSPRNFNKKKRIVDGDLILSETCRAIPYAAYIVHGDVAGDERASFFEDWVDGGILASFAYWKESIEMLEKKIQIIVPDLCKDSFYNGLYVECFSVLELFLCNIVFSLIYDNDRFYENAVMYWKDKKITGSYSSEEIESHIHDFFSQFVYHRFAKVSSMFKRVFNISIPNYDELANNLHRRNNIVHRHSVSNYDGMSATNATKEDVVNLLKCVSRFGEELNTKSLSASK